MPETVPSTTDLFTCTAIAERIAKSRGSCNRSSVFRAIQRLGIEPQLKLGKFCFYTEAHADAVADAMRRHNPNDTADKQAE